MHFTMRCPYTPIYICDELSVCKGDNGIFFNLISKYITFLLLFYENMKLKLKLKLLKAVG